MVENLQLRTGKLPAKHDPMNLTFAQFRLADVPVKVPHTIGHYELVSDWGMLGNDRAGDCVWAGGDHETEIGNAVANLAKPEAERRIVTFNDSCALGDYSAVTGYDPSQTQPDGSNPTDQGTEVAAALSYRRHTGLIDAAGERHKIAAYVELEPGNYEHVIEALYLFGVVGIGIEFPVSAMDQFNRGKPWTVVRSSTEGGHYVPLVGRAGRYLDVVTWGRVQRMTKTFFERYCDEAFAILMPEYLGSGKTPEGFDLQALTAKLETLKKP